MPRTRDQILGERRRLKAEYGELFDAISALLFRADPIGISFDNENLNEYDPEAGTILPRLNTCKSADDVLGVVHEEFVRWFDADNAGPKEGYVQVAEQIWQLWQGRQPFAADSRA
ncbi:MAG: hypothetical protein WA477_23120 [Candidatus Sulfotelmatobacter sp.]